MREYYTVKEIAVMVGLTNRTVEYHAQKNGWPVEKRPVRGGYENHYPSSYFPQGWRRQMLAHELSTDLAFIPDPEDSEFDESAIKQDLNRWRGAEEYNRRRAEARYGILGAWEAYFKGVGPPKGAALKGFLRAYNQGAAPGVEDWVYGVERKVTQATLYRWQGAFRDRGLPGLLASYGKKKGRSQAVTPEMRMFMLGQLAQKPHMKEATLVKLLRGKFNGAVPHRATVGRWLSRWKDEQKQLATFLDDPSQWKNKHQAAFGDMAAGIPFAGHTWEMDSTPADVMTLDGKRCAILGAIDVFTRRAVVVVAPTSKSLAIAACMRRGILAWGVPSVVRKDNGSDYVSKHITACTTSLGVETPDLPPYTPEAKPFIERFFRTMSGQLEELLPGYVGHSVADRQAIRERETWGSKIMKKGAVVEVPLTMGELQGVIDRWLEVYENTGHAGLKGKTPGQAAASCLRQPARIRDERVLDILLAPVGKGEYVVQKKGVRAAGGIYTAPELVEMVGAKVQVRQDLADAGRVYVFHSQTSEFICTATDEALTGQSLGDYIAAKKRHARRLKEKVRALETLAECEDAPYTILLDTAEMVRPDTGEVLENVVPFKGEADTPGIRAAREAALGAPVEEKAENKGVVIPIKREPEGGEWERYPDDLLENVLELVLWYWRKAEAVGLKVEDREHVEHLLRLHPWAAEYLREHHQEKLKGVLG